MRRLTVQWSAVFEAELEVEDNATTEQILEKATSVDTREHGEPLNESFQVEDVLDENGNPIEIQEEELTSYNTVPDVEGLPEVDIHAHNPAAHLP